MNNPVSALFPNDRHWPEDLLARFEALPDPRVRYVMAITPRSGSSWLCNLLEQSGRFGTPRESLDPGRAGRLLARIPGNDAAVFLRNVLRDGATRNGVSGVKASWFQFRQFIACLPGTAPPPDLRYILLTRRDRVAQAISLYLATASRVFHTNVHHEPERLAAREELPYDAAAIARWHEHIVAQEAGWSAWFARQRIEPLALAYEDLVGDIDGAIRVIARHLSVKASLVSVTPDASAFRPMADLRSIAWAERFRREQEGG